MTKKAAVKTRKSKASKVTATKSSKAAKKQATKAAGSPARTSAAKKNVGSSSSATKKFIADKTGRVVKPSPATPRLGKERIQIAVKDYVRRDA